MFGNEGIALGRMKQRVDTLEIIIAKMSKSKELTVEEKTIVEKILAKYNL